MTAFVLLALGAAVLVATILVARRTRPRTDDVAVDPSNPWASYAPRSTEDIEKDRLRLWPVAGALAGIVLMLGGLVSARTAARNAPAATSAPIAIELSPSPEPSPTETPTPTPTGSPDASPTPGASPTPRPSSTPRATGTPRPKSTPKPASTPKPTAAPAKPGPSISASTKCFNKDLHIGYSVTARSGTHMTNVTLSLDGSTKQSGGSGTTSYSNSYDTFGASAGTHRFVVTATASDGGSSSQTFTPTC